MAPFLHTGRLMCLVIPLLGLATSDNPPFCDDGYPLIVVGSGLAGHSAAAEALSLLSSQKQLGSHPVIILEKEPKFGGNSMKATSGINGANTGFQKEAEISDDVNDFSKDTFYSAVGGKNNAKTDDSIDSRITTLTRSSGDAVNWLQNEFDLKLTAISQCGGHSHARTHRPPAGPAGNIIVKTVHNKIESDVEWRYNCEAVELVMDTETKTVLGVKYIDHNDNDEVKTLLGMAVVMASGGFGNDHTDSSLLVRYSRNKEDSLPTTNGGWATGDGVKMGERIGAQLVDMQEIQIHPTGFVNPKAPGDSTKFLAPEALRGLGGFVINAKGQRFVNELDLRASVVSAMRAQQEQGLVPFRLVLNDVVREAFGPNLGFYIKFGLVKEYEDLAAAAKGIDVGEDVLSETMKSYVASAKRGSDEFGKTVFPNGESYDVSAKVYVAEITPVIHYTMGGLKIDEKAQIYDVNDNVMHGLFGAGEVTGGVHGKNRLAGNSLLECVVYGRIAARSALEYCENVRTDKKLHHTEL